MLQQSIAAVVLFVDDDCLPLTRAAVMEALQWAAQQNSFLGLAQATNHINKGVHVFAAPAFLGISRAGWKRLGKTQLPPNNPW